MNLKNPEVKTKKCSKCLEEKSFSEFYRDSRNLDGMRSWCKSCYVFSQKKWNTRNKENYTRNNKSWRNFHKLELREKRLRYLSSKEGSTRVRETEAVWRKTSPRYKAKVLNRKAAVKERTPVWARSLMRDYIPVMVELRDLMTKRTGIRHEIDHVIPLQAKQVSGLHVPWNLQIIPASENHKKQNKFELVG